MATAAPAAPAEDHHLARQLTLRDLVFSQVLAVVGSAWVGLAAGLGRAQTVVWLTAVVLFYIPMAAAVYYLNREMPLEGGLYVWARRAFGDAGGFLVAWNIWAYGLSCIATIFAQLPTEFAYMVGPRAAWVPDNHLVVLSVLALLLAALALSAVRGLALGKWVHNVSSAAMLLAFALLILAPLWTYFHHAPIHFTPFTFELPKRNLNTFALMGQVLFATSGVEYVAIMAGEARMPARNIGRSIWIATPIILLMLMLGTGSVLAYHDLHPATAINYIAPIPQALTLAFGEHGLGTLIARFAILLMEIRILGCASFLFTGVTRLPMAAGWDHLIPESFSRLHSRFRTPTNSILLGTGVIAALLALASIGSHAAQTFALLNNSSSQFYELGYMAMFAIPILGAKLLRRSLPGWVAWTSAVGFLATLFCFVIGAYPFVDEANPALFAAKILATVGLTNLAGYLFYRIRNRAVLATHP
jgi:amino acid transporter